MVSKGPGGGPCKLSPVQVRGLVAVLEAGPAAWGWDEDQCWTLARIAALIGERFGVCYTLAGVACLLHRRGFSVQVPMRRAAPGGRGSAETNSRARARPTGVIGSPPKPKEPGAQATGC